MRDFFRCRLLLAFLIALTAGCAASTHNETNFLLVNYSSNEAGAAGSIGQWRGSGDGREDVFAMLPFLAEELRPAETGRWDTWLTVSYETPVDGEVYQFAEVRDVARTPRLRKWPVMPLRSALHDDETQMKVYANPPGNGHAVILAPAPGERNLSRDALRRLINEVVVEFRLDAKGRPRDTRIVSNWSEEKDIGEYVLRNFDNWQIYPETLDGEPITDAAYRMRICIDGGEGSPDCSVHPLGEPRSEALDYVYPIRQDPLVPPPGHID